MSRRNWINLFSTNPSVELSSDLERGYEAALLIQSLELEYYGDRQIRPDLALRPSCCSSHDFASVQDCADDLPQFRSLFRSNGGSSILRSCANFS